MASVRSLDFGSLQLALELFDHCFVYFYSSWAQHKSAQYLEELSAVERAGKHSHFSVYVSCEQVEEYIVNIGVTELPVLVSYTHGVPVSKSYTIHQLISYPAHSHSTPRGMHCLLSTLICERTTGPFTLMVSGDRSSVGKSTFSLLFVAALLKMGFPASSIAYIKPVTQCEAEQPITVFCKNVGVECQGIGPVVFYPGFTRAFLDNATKSTGELLDDVLAAVNSISVGKRIVLIDGVGYPAVGSICGVSNADVAAKLNCPVLLVGKSGVGDAVDSFNLNASFFASKGVTVIGTVFNKIPTEGFYSLEASRPFILRYFEKYRQDCDVYGFIPQMQVNGTSATTGADLALLSSQNIETFFCQVNIRAVLRDMWTYHMYDSKKSTLCNVMPGCRVEVSAIDTDRWRMDLCTSTTSTNKIKRKAPDKFISKDNVVPGDIDSAAKRRKIQSREEILATAQLSGAKGG